MADHPASYADLADSFDHARFADLPEYAAASKALDNLAHALRGTELTLPAWLAMVATMGLVLPFSDMCAECDRATDDLGPIVAPHAADVADGRMRARYRCANGHTWTCGWATGAPDDI